MSLIVDGKKLWSPGSVCALAFRKREEFKEGCLGIVRLRQSRLSHTVFVDQSALMACAKCAKLLHKPADWTRYDIIDTSYVGPVVLKTVKGACGTINDLDADAQLKLKVDCEEKATRW